MPDYDQPYMYNKSSRLSSQAIPYRSLRIADFGSPLLPAYLQGQRPRLNAHAVVAIRTVPGANYVFSFPGDRAPQLSCGRIENLRFEAVMLPEESWWRPDLEQDREAYVLQHEQIHFALMEVAARKITWRSAMERDRLALCAEGEAKAKEQLTAMVDGWLAESRAEVLREHTRLDEETSHRFAPEVQQRWYDRVVQELDDLAAWD